MSKESALAVATNPVAPAPAVVDAAVEAPKDDLVSSRIAQIARKEAKYREEQESFKREREELHKSKSEFDPFYAKYKEFEAMRSKDPVAAIKMLGFSDTDYLNFAAAQEDKSTPEEKAAKIADAKIAEFRAEQAKEKQAEESRRNEESLGQFKKNISITLKTDPDRFEMCNFYGEAAQALIFNTVQEAYNEDLKTNPEAEPMTAEAAAELVEKYYEDHAESLKKLKKFNKENAPELIEATVVKKEEPLKVEVSPGMPPKTLTNRAAPTMAAAAKKIESRSEKRERLMRALASMGKP
jgi:hypothetical protein